VLNPVSSTVLTVFYILSALVLTISLAVIAFLLVRLNTRLEELSQKVEPLLVKTEHVLSVADEKLTTIGGKAEVILSQGEEVAASVHDRVERTAAVVHRTVNTPLIQVNSVAAGLARGWNTFRNLQTRPEVADAATVVHVPAPSAPIAASSGNGNGNGAATYRSDRMDVAHLSDPEPRNPSRAAASTGREVH